MAPKTVTTAHTGNWIIRLKRRRDGKKYYYRHDGCTTARKESSFRMGEETAKQLAYAISSQHPDFYAWAVPYNARHAAKKAEAAKAAKVSESLRLDDAITCTLVEQTRETTCEKSS